MKKILLIAIAFFTFAGSGLFAHFYNRTDDLSLRYILWKKGLHPYPSEIIFSALARDANKHELIRGKTKQEIKALFPDAREDAVNDYQRVYEQELAGRDYLWLDDSQLIIFFKDGAGDYISYMKG